jgi:hypothetical protein
MWPVLGLKLNRRSISELESERPVTQLCIFVSVFTGISLMTL